MLKELTPVDGGIADSDALEGWVRMVTGKVDMITTELTRLQDKMKRKFWHRCFELTSSARIAHAGNAGNAQARVQIAIRAR